MASRTKKATPKVKEDPEPPEPVSLRRSSRSTRGSVRPIVDLTKELEAGEEDEVQEVFVKREPSRRSSVKKEPPKREPVKRVANKKPVAKREPDETAETTIKEETTIRDEALDESKEEVEEGGADYEVPYELDEKEMKEINHAFDMNRLGDNNEYLNTDGLRTAIRSLGFEPRGDEIKRLMKKFARGYKVNRDGFHRLMAFKFSTSPAIRSANGKSSDEISRVFDLLDLDKTGMITLDNLKSIAKELNEDLNEEELREMIQEADQDQDFMINKHEFENIMKKTSLY